MEYLKLKKALALMVIDGCLSSNTSGVPARPMEARADMPYIPRRKYTQLQKKASAEMQNLESSANQSH